MDLNDISNPPLFEHGTFRFRKLRLADECLKADDYFEETPQYCMSKIESYDDNEEEVNCDISDFCIIEINEGVMAEVPVASAFHRHLIGNKGSTKRKLEEETKVKLKIPPKGQEGIVVVTSSHRKNIQSAITRIRLLVDTHRKKMPINYFLSFRATDIGASFERFKEDVLKNCKSKGIDTSLFQNPRKLHLTVAVVVLCNDREVEKAVSCMQSATNIYTEIEKLTGNGLEVEVKGLEVMNDDLSCVHVLYAKVQDSQNKLQMIADAYVSALEDTNFLSRQYDRVKLHITLMNSLFRKEGSGDDDDYNNNNNDNNRQPFDASEIFKRYSDYNFGKIIIRSIDLCRKGSSGKNGYYVLEGSVQI